MAHIDEMQEGTIVVGLLYDEKALVKIDQVVRTTLFSVTVYGRTMDQGVVCAEVDELRMERLRVLDVDRDGSAGDIEVVCMGESGAEPFRLIDASPVMLVHDTRQVEVVTDDVAVLMKRVNKLQVAAYVRDRVEGYGLGSVHTRAIMDQFANARCCPDGDFATVNDLEAAVSATCVAYLRELIDDITSAP